MENTTTTPPPPNLPPASIPPQPSHLPSELTSPTSLRFPTTWRCGTCSALHSILSLMTIPSSPPPTTSTTTTTTTGNTTTPRHCACAVPALQAVYDQFGAIYLFWRDDPAVADLSVPAMAEEARWRVWRAGGDGWNLVEGLGWEGPVGLVGAGVGRNSRALSQSSVASDESEDSMRVVYAREA